MSTPSPQSNPIIKTPATLYKKLIIGLLLGVVIGLCYWFLQTYRYSDSSTQTYTYQQLLNKGQQLASTNRDSATVLFRQASELSLKYNIPEAAIVEDLYKIYFQTANQHFNALQQSGAYDMMDIPASWYKMAGALRNTKEVQNRLAECQEYQTETGKKQ